MTADEDMPWSAPWTVRRGAEDEAAFVEEMSGALYAPNAAPEIRMFAEVMAVLDIPAEAPRGVTVAQLLEQQRAQREIDNVVPLRRFLVGRGVAAVAAVAAIAVGLVTASAYAGVLPDSIQKVAHSVLNAPSPKDHDAGPTGGSTSTSDPSNGGSTGDASSTTTRTGADGTTSGSAGATATADATQSAQRASSDVPTPGSTDHPTGSGSNNGGNGKGHKSGAPTTSPAPSGSNSPPVAKHNG